MDLPKAAAHYWKQVSLTVNYDGFAEWYRARGFWRKLFWTIIMIGTVAAIVYYTYTLTKQYLAYPSASQLIEAQMEKVQFPNVTICHTARFNKSYVHEKISIPFGFEALTGQTLYASDDQTVDDFIQWLAYEAMIPLNLTQQGPVVEALYQYYFNKSASPFALYDFISFLQDAALDCHQFITDCIFGGKRFDCCENAWPVWTSDGTCYRINIVGRDTTSQQSLPGLTGGLKIWAAVNRSQMPVGSVDDTVGLHVYFNDHITPTDNPVLVPPNRHALVRIDTTQLEFDPVIDGCTDDPPSLIGLPYTSGLCNSECMQNISWERCACKVLGYGHVVGPDEVCSPLRMATCVLPLTMGGLGPSDTTVLNEQMDCFFNNCPQTCQQWVHDTFVTYQDVVSSTYDPPAGVDDNDFYVFTAFYGEIKYTRVESAPLWDLMTFLSNLGGLLGLWTGVSVVTVVQLIYYCYWIPCCYAGDSKYTRRDGFGQHEIAIAK